MITQQVRNRPPATRQALEQAMSNLILSDYAKEIIGLVIGSGRSLFLTGPSGNGKTATARALVDALPGEIWIPYAIEVDGQVIRVFDTHNHAPIPHANDNHDRRWVRIRPPLVVAGGELTLDSLELAYTETQRFYEAPLHVKSNGGVLVVDDLGRQRCSATEARVSSFDFRFSSVGLHSGGGLKDLNAQVAKIHALGIGFQADVALVGNPAQGTFLGKNKRWIVKVNFMNPIPIQKNAP